MIGLNLEEPDEPRLEVRDDFDLDGDGVVEVLSLNFCSFFSFASAKTFGQSHFPWSHLVKIIIPVLPCSPGRASFPDTWPIHFCHLKGNYKFFIQHFIINCKQYSEKYFILFFLK